MRVLDLDPVQRGLGCWNGREWFFGREALGACRLDPQKITSDHWESLSVQPLHPVRGKMRHRADLAVTSLKLEGVSGETPVMALTPAGWDKEALRVFLGVARECAVNVRWLFPRAVLTATQSGVRSQTCRVWEWSWNQLHEVRLKKEDGRWRRSDERRVPDGGIFSLFRLDAGVACDLALDRLRFDPLHSGKTEQALFDSWWAWLHGAENWSLITPDGQELRFDEAREAFAAPRQNWAEKHGLADEPDHLLPGALRHLLDFHVAGIAPAVIELDVEDHDGASARWRETLPENSASGPLNIKPVTHVVVEGIARALEEPWSGPERPGDRVKLPNGEFGLAIYVSGDNPNPLSDDAPGG